MLQTWILIAFFLALGLGIAWAIERNRRPKRVTDERLREWLAYLTKQAKGNSRAFRKATTARLGDDEYLQIKTLYHPKLLAEWEERFGMLQNEFAIRAIEAEQVIRLQAVGKPLSSHDQDIRIREGLQQQTQPFGAEDKRNDEMEA